MPRRGSRAPTAAGPQVPVGAGTVATATAGAAGGAGAGIALAVVLSLLTILAPSGFRGCAWRRTDRPASPSSAVRDRPG